MRPAKQIRTEEGYILLFVLVALLAVAALVPLFARSLFERTKTTLKTERQDLAAAELEARYADFRDELRRALSTGAAFSFGNETPGALQTAFRSSENSLYTLAATLAEAGAERMANLPPLGPERELTTYAGMADPSEGLDEMRDDPFYGVPALVVPATLLAVLTPRLQPVSNSDPATLEGRLRLSFRMIPASSFSLASWGDLLLSADSARDAGRVYARGNVLVNAEEVTVPWKIVAGGRVEVGSNSRLTVRAAPNESFMALAADTSTASEAWLVTRATWREGALPVSTGRETPAALILPLPLATMLAARDPAIPEPGPDSPELLKFEHHASFVVREDERGELARSGPALTACEPHVIPYNTSRNRTGQRMLRVDVGRLVDACAAAGHSARIVLRSVAPETIVLLFNAQNLPAPFSIATPQPVYVAGKFNEGGAAASIITSARLTPVIAEY